MFYCKRTVDDGVDDFFPYLFVSKRAIGGRDYVNSIIKAKMAQKMVTHPLKMTF